MKTYETFDEIDRDLKLLRLERDIAFEELKMVKHNFSNSLKPVNWITTILKAISKYGVLLMIKKMFK